MGISPRAVTFAGRRAASVVLLVLVTTLSASCGSETATEEIPDEEVEATIEVTSPAFDQGGAIPARFSCDEEGISPPLRWTGVPDDAAALALVVDDPDAPNGTFVHWLVLDIDPAADRTRADVVPDHGIQAKNSAGDAAYEGLCPPSGTHHYRFTVYALSSATGLERGADLDQALDAVEERAEARGRLTATYAR